MTNRLRFGLETASLSLIIVLLFYSLCTFPFFKHVLMNFTFYFSPTPFPHFEHSKFFFCFSFPIFFSLILPFPFHSFFKTFQFGAEEMALWLRARAAVTNWSPRGSDALSWPPKDTVHMWCIGRHEGKTSIHTKRYTYGEF